MKKEKPLKAIMNKKELLYQYKSVLLNDTKHRRVIKNSSEQNKKNLTEGKNTSSKRLSH